MPDWAQAVFNGFLYIVVGATVAGLVFGYIIGIVSLSFGTKRKK